MRFDYASYGKMIEILKKNNYSFADYHTYADYDKCVILRHDVDMNLECAVKMSEQEKQLGVFATYFILMSTDLYNVASKKSLNLVRRIKCNGGLIGLHFDEEKYHINSVKEFTDEVKREANILSGILNEKIDAVSMHRPSKWVLESDIEIPGMINSYSKEFFENFKYMSDSRHHWRENVEAVVSRGEYSRLHILTHPFWYQEREIEASDALKEFIEFKRKECFETLNDNIKNLQEFIVWEDCR